MTRRSIILASLGALFLAPEAPSAQQPPAKIPRVGILTQAPNDRAPMFDAFRKGLRALGYVESTNIAIEYRYADGNYAGLCAPGSTRGPGITYGGR